jgi:hypothetical protein
MAAVNLALIAKLGWKILSDPESFCFQQLRAKYIQYGNFFTSPYPANASWLWKGILRTKSILQSGTCLKVSTSSNFPIWTTSWIPTIHNFKPSPKFPNNLNFPSFLISDLLDPDTLTWNSFSVNAIFDHISAREILRIKISRDPGTNYIWTPSCSGRFSSSSAYLSIINSNNLQVVPLNSGSTWKSIWKLNLNDRLRLFLWKMAWNILPTKTRLSAIFPSTSLDICPLCKSGEDSLQHLFFNCIFARVIWRNSFWPLDSTALNFSDMMDWIKLIINPAPLFDFHWRTVINFRFLQLLLVICYGSTEIKHIMIIGNLMLSFFLNR